MLALGADLENERKLLRAGVSRVVCLYNMGGSHMAQILKRPTVVDFFDATTMNGQFGLNMLEETVHPTSSLVGKTPVESNLRRDFGVILVAIKKTTEEMVFNPGPAALIEANDVVDAISKQEDMLMLV